MSGPLIQVEGVDFAYGSRQVLFDVSLHVGDSEALALLGTNGAGKSTLLRLLAGLNHPSSGRITFDGRDVTTTPAEQLVTQGVALITGGHAVFRDMTVRENLDIFATPALDHFAERQATVFETFPALAERLSSLAGSLSGGEQQQLALAKALLLTPRVLCIDELSLGLAPSVVEALLGVVSDLHRAGTTLVVVEQSLNIAAQICARAVFMEKGEVRFDGSTKELLERDDIARAVFLGT